MGQDVLTIDLVVEHVEAVSRLVLRLAIQLDLKFPYLTRCCQTHRQSPLLPSFTSTVAVGTAVAHCPPHRPVLARLAHTVPTLDVSRRSAHWDRDAESGRKEVGQRAAPESASRSNGSVGSA